MKNIYAAFAKNTVFANISFLIILFAGLLAATHMIKETFPEFSLDMIRIDVDYPGADPEEVEEGISLKIEEAIESVDGIKQYTTTSAEGHANVIIEVKENYDLYEVLDRVRSQVNGIATFPADAEKPIISEMLHRELVVLMSIYGDMSERRLKEWGGRLEDELKALPGISQVMTFGTRDYEISIEVSEERLRQYGLTFDQVAAAVARSNLNLAGGTIRTKDEQIRLRTVGRKYTGKDLSDIVVLAGPAGEVITLDRIATIRDDFVEDPFETTVNTKRAAFVMVYKTAEEDSIAITEAVDRYVADLKPRLPEGAEIEILFRTTDILKARMNLLIKNGILGLILVFGLLFIFLNERLSFWGGMGIPISVAGALAIIWGMGETINMISLFAFIMVLGIVVDDAIVVGEAIYVHRKNGDPPLAAAVNGVSEVGMPVVAAVTTSVAAFLPLAFVSGIMGKFIRILPIVVISCLAISLIECLLLMPAHLSHLPEIKEDDDKGKNPLIRGLNRFHARVSRGLEYFVAHIYTPFLTKALRWRYVSLCTAIAMLMLSVGLMKSGIMKFTVFPEIDGFIMAANIEFPSGTPPEVTRKAVKLVDEALIRLGEKTKTKTGEPMIKNHLTMVGLTAGEWPTIGPNFGGVQAIMLESEKRGIHSKDLMVAWEKEIGTIPGVKSITFEGMQAGPPGKPIEIWVQGYDMDEILAAADSLMKRLGKFDGVYEITSDFNPGQTELRLVLKPEARTLGLTVADLARQVNSGYFGNEAVRLQRGEEDVRIKVRYPKEERSHLSDVDNIRIRTPEGYEVPLLSVADVSFAPGYSKITRTDGMRRVMVSANVDNRRANANEIMAELNGSYFPALHQEHPDLRLTLQGEQKKSRESFGSLAIGFPLAILGIFVIIATMFRSYAQPLIIMFTVPFGIIGGVLGHLFLGYDLAIMSVFGMVALAGVVVNDAIVLIERINENLAEGMDFFDAVTRGGARRFRAIFLTTASTVGGLTPLILETDLQAKFMIPMAISLAAGVTFATVLTLILIPCLLTILNDMRRAVYYLKNGVWPGRRDVEPARDRHVDRLRPRPEEQLGAPLPQPVDAAPMSHPLSRGV